MAGPSYATPTDDQIAWQKAVPAPESLPQHLVAFLQGGVEPILGARTPQGRPIVGAGVGCRVRGNSLVRVFLPSAQNAVLLDALRAGSAVAATFSRARDHRSIQLKSETAEVLPPQSDDICEIARQCAIACDELVELGYSKAQATTYMAFDPSDLAEVAFRPSRVFTQTPGPGAGAELKR